jgi:small GTP-binding protein
MTAKELKLVAVGDGAVGKTSLLMVLNGKPFPERYVPTIFENYTQNVEISGIPYTLRIWDTAGQDEYDRLRPLSYSGVNAILLCFALDSKQSFVNLTEQWIGEVKHYCQTAKIILVGTKSDLRQTGNLNHVTNDEAQRFLSEQKCDAFIPCSPKSGEGVDQVFPATVKVCNAKKKKKCLIL